MKRDEYLGKLKTTLEQDDFAQVEEAISYFDELLQDRMDDEGLNEEEAVGKMEAPEVVAARLREGREKERQAAQAPEPEGEQPFKGIKTIQVKADQARLIRVRDRNTRLIVRSGEGEDIIIRHPESERIRYSFTLEDGRLSLLREPFDLSSMFFSFDFLSREMWEVTIQVPHELAAEMDLRTSNAKMDLEGFACWGQILAVTSNASVTVKDVDAKRLELQSSNGTMNLDKVTSRQDLKAVTSNAKITAEAVSAPQSLTLKTSNGGIRVSRLDSAAISLITSNAGIKGSLPGKMEDYTVKSGTSNGKNNLPNERAGGAKTLNVKTSNANISLEFDGGQ